MSTNTNKLTTTVIGSFPYDTTKLPNWFSGGGSCSGDETASNNQIFSDPELMADRQKLVEREIQKVIKTHEELGVDVFTNGEVGRENYIHFILRKWEGMDFVNLESKWLRDGAYEVPLPVIRQELTCKAPTAGNDWLKSQQFVDATKAQDGLKLKYTLPGPMTVWDTTVDRHYGEELACLEAIAKLINREARDLQEKGCKVIQIDEPVFCRYPEMALKYGAGLLDLCMEGIDASSVHRSMHMCCGYPDRLEQTDYKKADNQTYIDLAPALDPCTAIDSISIEDAHCTNDLAALLPQYKQKIIILGVLKIATAKVETKDQVCARAREALQYIDRDRLWLSPDCGLGMLPPDVAKAKLASMTAAAREV